MYETSELLELNELLDELKKRQEHPFNTYVPDDSPARNQLGYHKCKAWCRLLFGGNRSGKSRSAAQEIVWLATGTHPHQTNKQGLRIWIMSTEYRTIYEGIWLHLKNTLPPWYITKLGSKVPGWDIPSYIETKNGTRIDFISAIGGEETRRKVQAAEIDHLFIDEEIDGVLWVELQMRLLTRGGRLTVSATLIESEDWLVELEKQGEATQADPNADVRIFRLDTRSNKYNDQAALNRVLATMSPEEQEVRILGRSRKAAGLVYNSWNKHIHEIQPFEIPDNYTRAMALDAGFRTCAALWVAIDPNGRSIAYREMYLHNATLADVVHFINVSEGKEFDNETQKWVAGPKGVEEIAIRLIDPAAFATLQDGSVGVGVQLTNDYGFPFGPADNEWRTGVENCRKWLLTDLQGIANFRIFNTLQYFQQERSKYRVNPDRTKRDKDSAPDRPLKRNDHLMDCWRYLANAQLQYRPAMSYETLLRKQALNIQDVEFTDRNHQVRVMRERDRLRKQYLKETYED